jgi:hypothetical protein
MSEERGNPKRSGKLWPLGSERYPIRVVDSESCSVFSSKIDSIK